MLDGADLGLGRVVLDAHGVARVLFGEAVDLAVERGREEERLSLLADQVDDAVDGRAEAQVEHAVGLVEHEQRDAVEAHEAPLDQILEAAGRGHQDVRAGGLLGLAVDADAAEGGGDAQAAGARERAVSSATCMASSRVGTSTRPAGTLASRLMRSAIGIAKASVLPLPVGDLARTSRPASASGRTSSWMGKGSEMPRCASAAQTCSDAPRARKDWVLNVQLLADEGPFGG